MLDRLQPLWRPLYGLFIAMLAALVLLPTLLGIGSASARSCVKASPGVLDLSGCKFENTEAIKLDGEWTFYWNRLLTPDDLTNPAADLGAPSYLQVPSQWTGLIPSLSNLDRLGMATYRVRLQLPEPWPELLGLKVTNIRSASRLFVDGRQLGYSGSPGPSSDLTQPSNNPYIAYFAPGDREVEVLLQAANFTYYTSGIAESIYIGTEQAIGHLARRNETYDIAIIAGLSVMGIYFFGQSIQRNRGNRDPASIFLALFCLSAAVYMISHSEKLLYDLSPRISYEAFSRIQGISTVMAYWTIAGYTHFVTRKRLSGFIYRWSGIFAFGYTLVTLFFSVEKASLFAPPVLFETMIIITYVLYAMIRAIIERIQGSLFLLIAMLGVTQFIGALTANLVWSADVYAQPPISIFVFILAQGFFLAARSNHAYATIHNLSEELKAKSREKDQFLLKISHELRTPLQAMMHISHSLIAGVGGVLNRFHRKDMQLVEHTAKRLSVLVGDMLDYERMKDGTVELKPKTVDLAALVEVVLEVFRQLYQNPHITLANRIRPGTRLYAADENRITQIVYNLVENALNHTTEGQVEVYAVEAIDRIRITVADTGRGLNGEQLAALFREGDRAEAPEELRGLGLPISRMLAQLHGGDLQAESEPGYGSRFTLSLPNAPSAAPYAPSKPAPPASALHGVPAAAAAEPNRKEAAHAASGSPRYRILVVDEYVHRRALENLLAAEGYETAGASSAKEAYDLLLRDNSFDLCIIDALLPNTPGLALCRQIRQTYSPLDLPVLMTTANPALPMNEAGLASGANDWIRKPYEWKDLIARVQTLVQLKQSAGQLLTAEIAVLRAQIKPHFLYNAINTIIWMSKRDTEQTQRLLRDLSDFLRGSFDFGDRESLVSFQRELQMIRAYLSLEQARFGDRLQVEYDLQESDFLLPPLLLQPLVENAVRHGLMEKESGGTIHIRVLTEPDGVAVEIADDGVGIPSEHLERWNASGEMPHRGVSTGIGLGNVNRRLIKQYGRPLSIRERPGGGTIVTVHITREREMLRDEIV